MSWETHEAAQRILDGWYAELENNRKRNAVLERENAKLREAVEKASEIIVESCGECPVSRYEWLSWDRCAEECEVGKEPECWTKYLTGELGVEVKE